MQLVVNWGRANSSHSLRKTTTETKVNSRVDSYHDRSPNLVQASCWTTKLLSGITSVQSISYLQDRLSLFLTTWPDSFSFNDSQTRSTSVQVEIYYDDMWLQKISTILPSRAYRPQRGRGHVTGTRQNSNPLAKKFNSKIHIISL